MIRVSRNWIMLVALAAPASPFAAGPATDEDAELERTGDYLQVGIPLVALGLTFLMGGENEEGAGSSYAGSGLALDTEWLHMSGSPRHDLLLAIGRAELATYSLKYSIDSERPNGGGQSFPSGHTSIAFVGAEFIRKEYGGWWGVPSYLAASYVGFSRVETKNHWNSDVLAGAAIGILSNHDGLNFTLPWGQLAIAPSLTGALGSTVFDASDFATREMMETPDPGPVLKLNLEFRF